MKDSLVRPCHDCPFRKKSSPGWLGSATAREFIDRVDAQVPMECHTEFDYKQDNWQARVLDDDTVICVGAAHYLANTMSSPRPWDEATRSYSQAVDDHGYSDRVFASRAEFLAHHDNDMNKRYVETAHRQAYVYPAAREDAMAKIVPNGIDCIGCGDQYPGYLNECPEEPVEHPVEPIFITDKPLGLDDDEDYFHYGKREYQYSEDAIERANESREG